MSVKDLNKVIIISDALNGQIIDNIDLSIYRPSTIDIMIQNIIDSFIYDNEHGLLIKIGYKN